MVMGKALGLGTILVLSGVTPAEDPRIQEVRPDHVLTSIRELLDEAE
jgi:ribonucleotide monophosphatase NagD (HAD superfamily)